MPDTPERCGCRVMLTEAGTYLGAITYCPTHAAAPRYEQALREIANGHAYERGEGRRDPLQHCTQLIRIAEGALDAARAAIAKARGEGLTVTAPERVYREVAPNVFEDITDEEVVEQARIRAAIAKAKGDADAD